MAASVLFNRRLGEEEITSWLDLVDRTTNRGCVSHEIASNFLGLADTIAFVSTINDDVIGGTAIFRDRVRLGLALCSVAIRAEYRDSSAYQVIKTSLPFLKTVAIRDVDALIGQEMNNTDAGFPLSLELDSWMLSVLEKVGFEQIGTTVSCTLDCNSNSSLVPKQITWDERATLEGAKQLIWSQSKETELTNSIIWAALDFAFNRRTMRTYSANGTTKAVTSIERVNEVAFIGLLVTDPEYSEDSIIDNMVAELCRENTKMVHFPLIDQGQLHLVDLITEKIGASQHKRSLKLLRKKL